MGMQTMATSTDGWPKCEKCGRTIYAIHERLCRGCQNLCVQPGCTRERAKLIGGSCLCQQHEAEAEEAAHRHADRMNRPV